MNPGLQRLKRQPAQGTALWLDECGVKAAVCAVHAVHAVAGLADPHAVLVLEEPCEVHAGEHDHSVAMHAAPALAHAWELHAVRGVFEPAEPCQVHAGLEGADPCKTHAETAVRWAHDDLHEVHAQ